jgi:signal peptidase II
VSSTPAGRSRWMGALGIACIVVAIDQLAKHWALNALADDEVIDVVGSLRFNLAFNTGASFSIGSGLGPLLAVIVLVVVVALLRFVRTVPGRLSLVAVGLVVGGALGNLVDRVLRNGDGFLGGAVVDFIDVQWWPIFNIADMGVVIGALLLVVATWRAGDAEDADAGALDDDDADEPSHAPPGA